MRMPLSKYGTVSAAALSLITHLVGETAGADCVPYPVASKIRNVTLSNGAVSRGVALSIGSPGQEMAFAPRWPLNNVLIYGTDGHCVKPEYSAKACVTWRGGRYDPEASDTHDDLESGSIPEEPNSQTLRVLDFVTDTISIDQNTTLSKYPVGIPNKDVGGEGHQPLSGFGLGTNSVILETLKKSGKIASRTWSMFYGWMGETEETQRDGTFVFGGYDRAKASGRAYPLAMSDLKDGCDTRLMVTISDVILNFPNGSDTSLFGAETRSMAACIVPSYPVALSLNGDFYSKLAGLMGVNTTVGSGIVYNGELFEPGSTPYAGDMTIKVQSGPTIRIPNHQLVQPDRVIDESNGKLTTNGQERVLAIKYLGKNVNTLPSLGKQFLSAAYLMANLDAEIFTLWEADATNKEDLVAVDERGEESATFCTSGSESDGEGNAGPSSTPPPEQVTSSGGLSTGATAGIAVGVVAAALILGLAAFFLIRRRRRTRPIELPSHDAHFGGQSHELAVTHVNNAKLAETIASSSSPFAKSELSSATPPQMLDSKPVAHPVHELA